MEALYGEAEERGEQRGRPLCVAGSIQLAAVTSERHRRTGQVPWIILGSFVCVTDWPDPPAPVVREESNLLSAMEIMTDND